MDPLSLIQVAAIGVQTCAKLIEILQEFVNASEGIRALVEHLTGLEILLEAFRKALDRCQSVTSEEDAKTLIQSCESSLHRLDEACETFITNKAQGKLQLTIQKYCHNAKYVSKKNVIDTLIRDTANFSADVGKIMQICFFYKLYDDITGKLKDIDSKVSAVHTATEQNILKWVLKHSAPDSLRYEIVHRGIRKQRTASTCMWLFQTREWEELLNSNNSILWVYGIAGSGKSCLCSSIIDEVSNTAMQAPNTVYAYYYFSRTGGPPTLETCLMSLIHQLCLQHRFIPESLRRAYASDIPPESEALSSTLKTLMRKSQRTTLILDALDECTDEKNRRAILDWMQHIQRDQITSQFSLIITSREHRDINDVLSEIQSMKINLDHSRNHGDIRNYVERAILDHRKLNQIAEADPGLGKKMIDTLVGDANGMFLLASSRVNILRNIKGINRNIITRTLQQLPKDVDAVYDQILDSIPEETQDAAIRALCWLSMSQRPLTIEELAEASVVNPDAEHGPLIDPGGKFLISEDLIEIISDFVTVREAEPNRHVVQLAHATVYEYFNPGHVRDSRMHSRIRELATQAFMTKCCLKYITYGHNEATLLVGNENGSLPLLNYVCTNWYVHYKLIPQTQQTGEECVNLENQVLQFLGSEGVFNTWRALHFHDDENHLDAGKRSRSHSLVRRTGSPLYYAAYLGLPTSCLGTLKESFALDSPSGYWGTPMHAAVASRSLEVAMFLLGLGADPRLPNRFYGNILISAISNELPKMALYLIRNKLVDIQARDGKALDEAIASRMNDVAQALVNAGALVDIVPRTRRGDPGTTPTITAVLTGNCEMIDFLHQRGADLNRQMYEDPTDWKSGFMTALQVAAMHENYWVAFQLLLRLEADVNVTKGYACAPVFEAAFRGNTKALRALIDAGADIHNGFSKAACPLLTALARGHREAALMLLEADALLPGMDADEMSCAITSANGPSAWVDTQICRLEGEQSTGKDQMPRAPSLLGYTPKRPPRSDTFLTLPDMSNSERRPIWI